MSFTRLVLFVVVGLTGARWWQNHKAQQEEITTMADQSTAELNADKDSGQSVPLDTSAATSRDTTPAQTAPAPATPVDSTAATQNTVVAPSQANVDTAATSAAPAATETPSALPTSQAGVAAPAADPNALVMNFTADCWLEVTDATGKNCLAVCSVKMAI